MAEKAKPTIVEATGTAVGSKVSGKEIEKAMADAVAKAHQEGITDPDEIRRLQLEARQKIKQQRAG